MVEETKGATEHSRDDDALWEDCCKELSDDFRQTGPSDGQKAILADKVKCCLVFNKIKMYESTIKCLIS
jgi:hypothetical protein